MKKAIEQFIKDISTIDDPDYGDFMRKANHYLIELEDEIYKMANDSIKGHLREMKNELQYSPNWDIESTRDKLLLSARMIDIVLDEEFRPVSRLLSDSHKESVHR